MGAAIRIKKKAMQVRMKSHFFQSEKMLAFEGEMLKLTNILKEKKQK